MKTKGWVVAVYSLIAAGVLLAAHWGSHTVTVIAENTPVIRAHRILIDPGHGGIDGGALSISGRQESMYNLEIALRLRDLLTFLGYETEMTRTEDISIYKTGDTIAQKKASDLKERVRIANSSENTILLSIHQNMFSDSQYSGAQVFYSKTKDSKELAEQLQQTLTEVLNPINGRKIKRSNGVYLMEHIHCPGVLIECGFLSNPEEEFLLRSAVYQKKLCCAISCGIIQHLSNT